MINVLSIYRTLMCHRYPLVHALTPTHCRTWKNTMQLIKGKLWQRKFPSQVLANRISTRRNQRARTMKFNFSASRNKNNLRDQHLLLCPPYPSSSNRTSDSSPATSLPFEWVCSWLEIVTSHYTCYGIYVLLFSVIAYCVFAMSTSISEPVPLLPLPVFASPTFFSVVCPWD